MTHVTTSFVISLKKRAHAEPHQHSVKILTVRTKISDGKNCRVFLHYKKNVETILNYRVKCMD
jgi:hypothetical protein